jgi:Fe-S-cluster-containing hydrogenase component 2
MAFDTRGKRVIKCDLCDGDPTCVRFCEPEALQYVDATTLSIRKKREAAGKLSELMEKFARV